jgi:hypothetical protein
MEPERPKIDRLIIEFLKVEKLHPADFTIRRDGVVRLNPQLARRVAGLITYLVTPSALAKEVASGRLDTALDRPVAVIQSPGGDSRFAQTANIPDSSSGQVKLTQKPRSHCQLGVASFA